MTSADIVLPVPGVAGEQRRDPAALRRPRAHAPLVEDAVAVPGAGGQLAQLRLDAGRQHEVVPADDRLDPSGQALEATRVLGACASPQVRGVRLAAFRAGMLSRCQRGPMDLLGGQPEGDGLTRRIDDPIEPAVERGAPQEVALTEARGRGIERQGHAA